MTKKRALQRLNDDLNQSNIATVTRYYVKIPLSTEHKGHPLGASATINHCVDRRIISKIYDLVHRGVTRPEEVRRCLEEFVERENCLPMFLLMSVLKNAVANITPLDKT